MSSRAEITDLRQELAGLAGRAEVRLVRRYRLRPLERPGAYRRVRMMAGRILRRLGLRAPAAPPEPWLPYLKHHDRGNDARPLLIWALGMDRDTLREACGGFEKLLATLPGFVPVLVTDVADFAFFSRLGWLAEYVPSMSAPAGRYADRKRRYLAWRYRDAAALPATVGLRRNIRKEDLLLD